MEEHHSSVDELSVSSSLREEENLLKLDGPNGFSFQHEEVPMVEYIVQPCLSWKEVRMQCFLAGPLIVGNLLSFFLQMISLTFVGHCGELELSGASIANSFSIVTGFSVVLGMGSALETLCGQANGAGQYHKLGIYMQRAMVVLNATSIPLACILANVESILLVLGQNAQIASKAGAYAVWLIPTLFAVSTYQPFAKFLQSQSILAPILLVSLTTLLCHVPICWFLVFKSGMGFTGGALAFSISYWINVFLVGLYVRFSHSCARSRAPLSLEALQDLKGFFKLAIPSAAMICLEWWSYEVLVILSGLLSNPELQSATISICVSTESLIYTVAYGVGAAVSIRVSNELGAGHPEAARAAVNASLAIVLSESLLVAGVLLLVRNVWGLVYSNEEELVHTIAGLIPLLAISTTFDSLQGVLSGTARGAGWQRAGAFINLLSFYIVGLPTGCLLAFVAHLDGKGLWLGLIVGVFVQFLTFGIITYFTDWQKEATKVVAHLKSLPSVAQPLLISQA